MNQLSAKRLVALPGMDGTGVLLEAFTDALGDRLPSRRVAYPREAWSYAELERLVEEELAGDSEEGFILLAESFSGPIALRLAAKQTLGLRALVLAVTFAEAPPSPLLPIVTKIPSELMMMEYVPCWAACGVMLNTDSPEGARDRFCQVIKEVSPQAVSRRLEEVRRLEPPARPIDVPALYIQANNDRILPRSALDGVRRALPQLEVFRLPGPHLVLSASPDRCAERVLEFARSLSALE